MMPDTFGSAMSASLMGSEALVFVKSGSTGPTARRFLEALFDGLTLATGTVEAIQTQRRQGERTDMVFIVQPVLSRRDVQVIAEWVEGRDGPCGVMAFVEQVPPVHPRLRVALSNTTGADDPSVRAVEEDLAGDRAGVKSFAAYLAERPLEEGGGQ